MVKFPSWKFPIPDCDSHNPVLLDFFLSFDPSIDSKVAFPSLGNSDHVVAPVFSNFPLNSKRHASFYHAAHDYSRANWDGLLDHFRDNAMGGYL